jgi:pyruvate dehydrogenase E2 component (dihydrolipoamide acetyltransferase)
MGYIVRMPQMGMSMEEGTVVEWRVPEGETVSEGETLAVVESEKTQADVETREDAVLRRTLVAEGDAVAPGDPIGVVAAAEESLETYLDAIDGAGSETASPDHAQAPGDDAAADDAHAPGDDAAADDAHAPGDDATADDDAPSPREPAPATTSVTDRAADDDGSATAGAAPADSGVRASPGARRLAADRGVDVGTVDGTGPEDVVTEADVRRAAEATGAEAETADAEEQPEAVDPEAATTTAESVDRVVDAAEAASTTSEAEPASEPESTAADPGVGPATRTVAEGRTLGHLQQTTADRLSRSAREAPHVTLDRRVDTDAVETVLAAAETLGVDAGFTDLLVAAAADALAAHPEVNALYEDEVHRLIEEVNVAVAVDAGGDLLTPVIPDADALSVTELNRVRRDRSARVLDGERSADLLSGATFTISNLGPFGVDRFTPIINPPQVAILGVGRSRDGGVTLSLSFDHRVLNGAGAARFLDTLAGVLTDADALAARFDLED